MKQVGFVNRTWIQTADKILVKKILEKKNPNKSQVVPWASELWIPAFFELDWLGHWEGAWVDWSPSCGWVQRFVLSPKWIHQHQIKDQHNMAAFSSVEVGHLSSTSACLLKPWGNLLFLRLLPSIKFGWSWIMHLKVVRHIHTGVNTLHVSMKSTFLQDLQEGRC